MPATSPATTAASVPVVGQQDDLFALAHGQAAIEDVGEADRPVADRVMLLRRT